MKSKGANKLNDDPNDELKKLGQRIKVLRIQKGYSSFEAFANQHSMSRSQVGRFEKGQNVNYLTLNKIVRALGTTFKEFFSEGFD